MKHADLLKITEDFGAPVYVYDTEKIISQFNRLTRAFESVPRLKLNYAAKALSNLSILRLMNSLGSGLDTVSIQEVRLGLMAGFAPEDIIYTPNGVSLEEIEASPGTCVYPDQPSCHGWWQFQNFRGSHRFQVWDQYSSDTPFA